MSPIAHLFKRGRTVYMRAYRRLYRTRIAAQKREHRRELRALEQRTRMTA